ncbi:MAG: molybdopterin-dependent oxidoreductase [Actinomycetota bacterium]|nr:molybdopterin-dependent oxidoreductase [Actinomycetota bacterium]
MTAVPPPDAVSGDKPIGRRVILGMLGLGVAGVLGGARVQDAMNKVLSPVQAADPTGLTGLIPAAGGFRIYSVSGSLPSQSATGYRLKVDGLVDRPLTLTVADLRAMPATRLVRDFQCVTGWRVQGVHWTGVPLSALLDQAGVQAGGAALSFDSFDGSYTESLTMDQARRPDVIVAYEMLGGPVTRAHGGPVRLYVAPMYGYKSCKWLSRISVVPKVNPGYWENLGYDVDAWVGKSNQRSDHPTA